MDSYYFSLFYNKLKWLDLEFYFKEKDLIQNKLKLNSDLFIF